MRANIVAVLTACSLLSAFADTIAWWRFEGTPDVQTVEGDTFENSATGAAALPALNARSINGAEFGYDQTYMPRYVDAFCSGYEIYDPVARRSYQNTASISFRDTLTDKANANNGIAQMPGSCFPTSGNVTIELFFRAPFRDDAGANVRGRDMIPLMVLPLEAYKYSTMLALYHDSTKGSNYVYCSWALRNEAGENIKTTGGSYGDDRYIDNKWHHVAQVLDFTNHKIYCYLDYTRILSTSMPEDAVGVFVDPTKNFLIGGTDMVTSRKFQGLVDEVRISNEALVPEQFLRMRPADTPPDVLAYISFETPDWWGGDGLPLSVTSEKFSMPYLTTSSATAPVAVQPASSAVYSGVYDTAGVANAKALDLNRSGESSGSVLSMDYLTGSKVLDGVPELTLEFYAKFKTQPHTEYWPIANDGGYSFRWYFYGATAGTCDGTVIRLGVPVVTDADGNTKLMTLSSGVMARSISDGNWHHFAFRFSTAQKVLIMDIDHGRLAHVSTALPDTTLGMSGTEGKLVFGGRTYNNRLCDMVIDDIRVTSRVMEDYEFLNTRHLTAEEQMVPVRAWVRFENDWTIGPDIGVGNCKLTPSVGTTDSTTEPAFMSNSRRPFLKESSSDTKIIANDACASLVQRALVKSGDVSFVRNLRNATYEAFVKVNAISNAVDGSKSTHIFYVGQSSTNPDIALRLSCYDESKYMAMVVWRNGADSRESLTIPSFCDGKWHHHAITVSESKDEDSGEVSTTVTYYRDYKQEATKTVKYARVLSQMENKTLIAAGESWGTGHDYEIDEIRVSAGVLPTSEFMRRKGYGFGLIFR